MASSESQVDDVTGERVGAAVSRSPLTPKDGVFRLGIAGYDLWPHAINFCHALENADFTQITAVWDDEPEHLARLVEITGAVGYSDLEEFCNSDIQGAVITARTSLRCGIAKALAAGGKHVLSDKPMAMNADEGREMVAACRDANVLLMGGYNFHFWKTWNLMKRVMDSGELGEPFHLYCAYNTGMIRRSEWEDTLLSDWTDSSATAGGGWLTHGDHAIDLTRWLLGVEFTDVLADMRKLKYPEFDVEDYGVAHYSLSNGGTALIASDAISPDARLDVTVACANGGMSYSMRPEPKLKIWGAPSFGADVVEFSLPEHWVDALGELTRAFVTSVETGTPPVVTAEDNVRVLEVVDATYRSARDGGTVAITQQPVPSWQDHAWSPGELVKR
jgi:UDP-N-acetyl-2-amino-2-deoxyglucuronate dehydrogenase